MIILLWTKIEPRDMCHVPRAMYEQKLQGEKEGTLNVKLEHIIALNILNKLKLEALLDLERQPLKSISCCCCFCCFVLQHQTWKKLQSFRTHVMLANEISFQNISKFWQNNVELQWQCQLLFIGYKYTKDSMFGMIFSHKIRLLFSFLQSKILSEILPKN